tara:strand:- start:22 stop:654 length:633 start_codon:yes stop_codon:yes gene_type:complete
MIAIIQARCNSRRFKNKVLSNFIKKPIIQHVVDNVKKTKKITKVIVATSKNKSDDKLAKFLREKKINFYRGSHLNVAKRLLDVAKKNNVNFFTRISADSPLINPRIIDSVISLYLLKKKNKDLITNVFPRTFPKGQSIEIIRTSILKDNLRFFNSEDKEHVTRYFYKNYKNFSIINFKNKNKKKLINMAVDTRRDLILLEKNFKFQKGNK